ncbi:MAG: SusC/RagA family TonB-linked outer membrane protein [Ginsengibacter sp.]
MTKKEILSVIMLFLFPVIVSAQTVNGYLKNNEGTPIQGATITSKSTNKIVLSNEKGYFSLSVPTLPVKLEITSVGYKTKELTVTNTNEMQIVLDFNVSTQAEVVVVGYGTQSRREFTGAASKLDTKVLENIPFSNATSAMQGTLSGVRVQTTTGQPGAAPRVVIRGGTSLINPSGTPSSNPSGALYVVDGVIVPSLNDFNPSDIESMQVLKDAASTAIYGARASNGVVIVTTKSAKAGRSGINYSFDVGLSEVGKKYDLLSGGDYIRISRIGTVRAAQKVLGYATQINLPNSFGTGNDLTKNTPFTTQYLTPDNKYKLDEGWQSIPDPLDPSKTIIYKDTDFQNILFRKATSYNHVLAFSGANEKGGFNASVGYHTNSGVVITTEYKRFNFDLGGFYKIKDNLKVFGKLFYSNSENHQVYENFANNASFGSNELVIARSGTMPSTAKAYFEDGSLAYGQSFGIGNPLYQLSTQKSKNVYDNMLMSMGAKWGILPGLSFDPQVSMILNTFNNRFFQQGYYNGPTSFNSTRNASGISNKYIQKQADAVFNYVKSINDDHNFKATAGFSYFGVNTTSLTGSGTGAPTDLIPTLNASTLNFLASGREDFQNILGYFGRLNYDYKEKYLLSLNARYDGASNLGLNNKWGFFPGVSAGWNVHKEKFWDNIGEKTLRLKLRASYGVNGNISNLSFYQAQGQYSPVSYGGNGGLTNAVLENQNLHWERSATIDLGTDIELFDNRIGIIFDYFDRTTNDLLANLPLPPSSGFTGITTNLATLQNSGIELELRASMLPKESQVVWNISFNFSKVNNKILKLPYTGTPNNRVGGVLIYDKDTKSYEWKGGLQEGGRIGDMFGYQQIGIYKTDAEAAAGPLDMLVPTDNAVPANGRKKYGGDVNWLDVDGNGIIDTRDQVYLGNSIPTTTGGFSTSLSYKKLSLYVRMDYTLGHTIYNYAGAQMTSQFTGGNGLLKKVLRSWQKPGDVTDVARYYFADQNIQNNYFRGNSVDYEKGDFLALREVTLSYPLPENLLNRIKIERARVYVTGSNLHYFTKYSGLNPEDGGNDRGRYPLPREVIFGLNISL